MRVTYRNDGVKKYWATRWDDIPADAPMENSDIYPLKYAELVIKNKNSKIIFFINFLCFVKIECDSESVQRK